MSKKMRIFALLIDLPLPAHTQHLIRPCLKTAPSFNTPPTVLVTPGISPGELEMKNIAINSRLPLIHLQKEPITKKPEGERFFACAEGSLLILAPWTEDLDAMPRPSLIPLNGGGTKPGQTSLPSKQGERGGPSDYDRFHNMNLLAEQICRMDVTCTNLSFRVIGE